MTLLSYFKVNSLAPILFLSVSLIVQIENFDVPFLKFCFLFSCFVSLTETSASCDSPICHLAFELPLFKRSSFLTLNDQIPQKLNFSKNDRFYIKHRRRTRQSLHKNATPKAQVTKSYRGVAEGSLRLYYIFHTHRNRIHPTCNPPA